MAWIWVPIRVVKCFGKFLVVDVPWGKSVRLVNVTKWVEHVSASIFFYCIFYLSGAPELHFTEWVQFPCCLSKWTWISMNFSPLSKSDNTQIEKLKICFKQFLFLFLFLFPFISCHCCVVLLVRSESNKSVFFMIIMLFIYFTKKQITVIQQKHTLKISSNTEK